MIYTDKVAVRVLPEMVRGVATLGDSVTARNQAGWIGFLGQVEPFLAERGAKFVGNYGAWPCLTDGIPGNRLDQMQARLSPIVALAPSVITLNGGLNDLSQGATLETARVRYAALRAATYSALPNAQVVVLATTPIDVSSGYLTEANVVRLNGYLAAEVAAEKAAGAKASWLNIHDMMVAVPDWQHLCLNNTDGVHPLDFGYAQFSPALLALIFSLLDEVN